MSYTARSNPFSILWTSIQRGKDPRSKLLVPPSTETGLFFPMKSILNASTLPRSGSGIFFFHLGAHEVYRVRNTRRGKGMKGFSVHDKGIGKRVDDHDHDHVDVKEKKERELSACFPSLGRFRVLGAFSALVGDAIVRAIESFGTSWIRW